MSRRRSLLNRPRSAPPSRAPEASTPPDSAPAEAPPPLDAAGRIDPASVDPEVLFDDTEDVTLEEASEDWREGDPEPATEIDEDETVDVAEDLSLDVSEDVSRAEAEDEAYDEDADFDTVVDRPLSHVLESDEAVFDDDEEPLDDPATDPHDRGPGQVVAGHATTPVLGDTGVAEPLPVSEAETVVAAPPAEAQTVITAPPPSHATPPPVPRREPTMPPNVRQVRPKPAEPPKDMLFTASMVFFGIGLGMALMLMFFGVAVMSGLIQLR